MSASISDLAREAELLKSNMSACPGDSPPPGVWPCRQRLEDVYRQILLLDLDLALERRVEADLWAFVFRTQINSLLSDVDHQQVLLLLPISYSIQTRVLSTGKLELRA